MSFWDLFDEMEREMARMRKHYDRLFNSFDGGFRQPLCDVKDEANKLIIELELPGVSKKDIEVNITEDELEVKSESRVKQERKRKNYYQLERGYSGFYRRFALPAKVKPKLAKAVFKDGVLRIVIPKLVVKKPEKSKIKVAVK